MESVWEKGGALKAGRKATGVGKSAKNWVRSTGGNSLIDCSGRDDAEVGVVGG